MDLELSVSLSEKLARGRGLDYRPSFILINFGGVNHNAVVAHHERLEQFSNGSKLSKAERLEEMPIGEAPDQIALIAS
jgi:hypothetical protein